MKNTIIIREKAIAVSSNKLSIFALGFFVLACLALYVHFANSAVRTVTMLEKTRDDLQNLNLKVSEMESKRLFADNLLNMESAKNLGLVQVKNQTFVVSKNTKTAYSY